MFLIARAIKAAFTVALLSLYVPTSWAQPNQLLESDPDFQRLRPEIQKRVSELTKLYQPIKDRVETRYANELARLQAELDSACAQIRDQIMCAQRQIEVSRKMTALRQTISDEIDRTGGHYMAELRNLVGNPDNYGRDTLQKPKSTVEGPQQRSDFKNSRQTVAAGINVDGCVSAVKKNNGGVDLKNICQDKINIWYCITDNPKSAHSCSKRPLSMKTLAPGTKEFVPFYEDDGGGEISYAACAYPSSQVGWDTRIGDRFECR